MIEVMAIIIVLPPGTQRIDFYYQQDKQPGLAVLEQKMQQVLKMQHCMISSIERCKETWFSKSWNQNFRVC